MSRAVLLALAAALALAPAAAAAPGDSIAIQGLPAAPVKANATSVTLPFDVEVTIGRTNCAGGTAQAFTVTLDAHLVNVAGRNVTATVNPPSFTVDIGPSDTVQSAKTYTHTGATLVVTATGLTIPIDAVANVTATAGAVNCNISPLSSADPGSTTASAKVEFRPQVAATVGPAEEPVPGLEAPMLALAVVGLALVLRRRV